MKTRIIKEEELEKWDKTTKKWDKIEKKDKNNFLKEKEMNQKVERWLLEDDDKFRN